MTAVMVRIMRTKPSKQKLSNALSCHSSTAISQPHWHSSFNIPQLRSSIAVCTFLGYLKLSQFPVAGLMLAKYWELCLRQMNHVALTASVI